jgi:2-(1,2-epoxy-1,2-dihydrophenyl)acetyl-CoA isomerase
VKELADEIHKAISVFARMAAPVVIAVNGTAAGAGFSLSLIGDVVLASTSAKFTMAYTAAGLTPDGSSTYYLPRLVGLRRAQELFLTNRTLTASEAADWGLVTRVVPDGDLEAEARAICRRLADGPAQAQSMVKKLLLCSLRNGLEDQMELEGRAIANAAASADGKVGISSFVAKRKPNFRQTGHKNLC